MSIFKTLKERTEFYFPKWTGTLHYTPLMDQWKYFFPDTEVAPVRSEIIDLWMAEIRSFFHFTMKVLNFFGELHEEFRFQEIDLFAKCNDSYEFGDNPFGLHLSIILPATLREKAGAIEAAYFQWYTTQAKNYPYSAAFWVK